MFPGPRATSSRCLSEGLRRPSSTSDMNAADTPIRVANSRRDKSLSCRISLILSPSVFIACPLNHSTVICGQCTSIRSRTTLTSHAPIGVSLSCYLDPNPQTMEGGTGPCMSSCQQGRLLTIPRSIRPPRRAMPPSILHELSSIVHWSATLAPLKCPINPTTGSAHPVRAPRPAINPGVRGISNAIGRQPGRHQLRRVVGIAEIRVNRQADSQEAASAIVARVA